MPNLQNRIAHQRAGRLFCFWARPMHQGGRNGATKPLFVRERARLLVLFPRSVTFRTKSLGEIWRKMPNLQNRITHQRAGRLFCFWARPMHQGGRNGATKPLFRARKDALTSVVSKVRNFSNKKFGEIWRKMPNLQNRITHQRAGRLFCFWARPMHQGGRNGATKPPFRARKDALTSVVSKVRNFSNKKIGGHLEKNAQSTKPNYASTCRAIILFLGSANAPRRAQRSHQATFSCEKGRAY